MPTTDDEGQGRVNVVSWTAANFPTWSGILIEQEVVRV